MNVKDLLKTNSEIKDYKKYLALSRCIDTTFGNSSNSPFKVPIFFVKLQLIDENTIKAKYTTTVNIPSHSAAIDMRKSCQEEGLNFIHKRLEKLKKDYEALTGKKIKIKLIEQSVSDSFEYLTYRTIPKMTAYYHLTSIYKII